ncbi:MAG: glycerol kinase GlpK [Gemmatimonadota bacterium]|jgi:glycerol kinase|nr:glycerol kinase GlpK [Gemmatimonadota bacterium]
MILAIDEGTTGITCLVIDRDGRTRGRAYSEITQFYPRPGWVEHDAMEIWLTTCRLASEAAATAGVELDSLAAVGITNQRETVVLWDRETGDPVHHALVWQDRRTADTCATLKAAGHERQIRDRTGLVVDPYFSATKIAWILDNNPDLRRRAEAGELAAGTMDSWLVWKMTKGGSHLTDPTNASRTLLFNLDSREWDASLLDLFGVPAALLPSVRPSSEVYANSVGRAFGAEIPIAGIAGDQQAALFGQGCWAPGSGKNTYGTGAFLLLNTGEKRIASEAGLLTTAACGPRGEYVYALEGSVFVAGAAVQWLRDALGVIHTAAETEALARSLNSNADVYFVPAFTGLGAPHWDPHARGTILGLTRGTGTAHLARAALEAVAFSTHDVVRAMEADYGLPIHELRVDGGQSANNWLMQFQADLLGIPVRRPAITETTAYGAAGLAGLASGFWKTPEEFLSAREESAVFEPGAGGSSSAELLAGWNRAVRTARFWSENRSPSPVEQGGKQ